MKKYLIAFTIMLILFSCSKNKQQNTTNVVDNTTNSIIAFNEQAELITDLGNQNSPNDFFDNLEKKIQAGDFISNLPEIYEHWKTGNYVKLPDCPEFNSRGDAWEAYNSIFSEAPLTGKTYPMLTNFLYQFSLIRTNNDEKMGAYSAIANASQEMHHYEAAIHWYTNMFNIQFDESSQDYQKNKNFQYYNLSKACQLLCRLYMEEEALKYETEILNAPKNVKVLYYTYLTTMYAQINEKENAQKYAEILLNNYEDERGISIVELWEKSIAYDDRANGYRDMIILREEREEETGTIW